MSPSRCHSRIPVLSLSLLTALAVLAFAAAPATAGKTLELLITEVTVTPTDGEFIELYNPTGETLDLSDVYLTDATFSGGAVFYYNIVTGVLADAGGGGFSDFHARFPDGALIGPGEYQCVALAGSEAFFSTYGFEPTYELYEDGVAADGVPDMREALAGSIADQGGLSNSGEVVILYTWDGAADLVEDLDYALWGDKAEAVDKTGVMVDGPDGDAVASSFLADTAIASQDVIDTGGHGTSTSWQRIDLTEGSETLVGGNGTTGHDETSEDLSSTFIEATPTPCAPAANFGAGVLVINEIHADPDFMDGDANGDGDADADEDMFVEIVNDTGGTVDMSGWTLSDSSSVRHTFPPGSTIANGCGVLIFGGGTPTGSFSGFRVQTASTGALGLDTTGDTLTLDDGVSAVVMATYGAEADDDQSVTLDPDVIGLLPYVKHSLATGSGGSLFSPGTLIDGSAFPGCPPVVVGVQEIFDIQGSGAASPFAGSIVTTEDNVVTAVGPEGFFMQTPDVRDDADIDTSNGIYVFTGVAPGVAVGDLVDVTGLIEEFFEFTEFTNGPTVAVDGTAALPPVVTFDATTPSPDPLSPSCAAEYECYEGMRVEVVTGTVGGPSQSFGSDPIAEFHGSVGTARAFREPGVEFPGLGMPPIPTWDGNPEVFEVDPDKLGLTNIEVSAGSTFAVTGALGFEFGGYEIWADSLTTTPPGQPLPPTPVRARAAGEFTVGSLNMFRFFDDIDDAGPDTVVPTLEYLTRRLKFCRHIHDVLGSPDVLSVQEVEKLGVLEDLADDLLNDATCGAFVRYTPYLIEGNDPGGIDVGFLVRDTVEVHAVTQLGAAETLSCNGSTLHDRPPLLLEATFVGGCTSFPFAVLGNHTRSLSGIDDEGDTCGPVQRVRQKRLEQAQSIAQMVQDFQTADPTMPLIVVGDLNAFQFTDGYVDVVGQIAGTVDETMNLLSEAPITSPTLFNEVLMLPADEQYSFVFGGNAQVLDHALTSSAAAPFVTDFEFGRGNADAPRLQIEDDTNALRASDHDGFALYLDASSTAGIFCDGFESGDISSW